MIMGVIGFYFVLSDINSIISSTLQSEYNFSSRVTMLEKIQEKYKMDYKVYIQAKRTLFEEERETRVFNIQPFVERFPKFLQLELKYSIYSRDFKNFGVFNYVDPLILAYLGDAVTRVHIPAGNGCFL